MSPSSRPADPLLLEISETLLHKGYNMSASDLHTFFTAWLQNNQSLVEQAGRLYRVGSSPLLTRPYWAATHFLGDLIFTCPALRGARLTKSPALSSPSTIPAPPIPTHLQGNASHPRPP